VSGRLLTRCALSLLLSCAALPAAASGPGERIYREGLLPSGQPLRAVRGPSLQLSGTEAACINCHRRSGLGMTEGRATIPPVAGIYLEHPRAGIGDDLDLPFVEGMRPDRDPYTDASLARAIRSGVGVDGNPLNYLMPRYDLDDASMGVLIDYLRQLSPGKVPGVSAGELDFATIVTPDANPVVRAGVLEVLDKFFADQNHYRRGDAPRLRSSHRMMFKAYRSWRLHVWELTGRPETWEAQLRARLAAEPVFAVISGVGGKEWGPVHRFCESQSLPCLFPNVELPAVDARGFDTLYLSKGVLLEAGLIAQALSSRRAEATPVRVVQVFRADDVGREAARELARQLGPDACTCIERAVSSSAGSGELARALSSVGPQDIVVLWLRPADLAALGPRPKQIQTVYVSGRMGGLEHAPLSADWRAVGLMAYPFDLPELRRVRVDFPRGWFSIRTIPVVAEQAQTDTWMACSIVSDALNHMADTFVRDYLIERIEQTLEHRVVTGYYPRLALAQNQRFASKGGYLVRFAEPTGTKIRPEGGWITGS
jgi:hypothetical protein